jgi:hypothetical protein
MVGRSGSPGLRCAPVVAERAHAAGLDVPARGDRRRDHHLRIARDDVHQRGSGALVGHVHELDAGEQVEHLAREDAPASPRPPKRS